MRLPTDLVPVLQSLRAIGRPRLVGGCVRDWRLGLTPKDYDVEVADGADFAALERVLAPFGATDVVGRSFGVIKLRRADGGEYDFSLPRRESKTGAGHRGFRVAPDPSLSDAEAAARRDFTINAMAWDPFTEALIDPHGGERDLRAGLLRHVSAAFSEDPLRVLRAMQFAGRFGFKLAPETAALAQQIACTYAELPPERVWGEWVKWAEQSRHPAAGLRALNESGWLAHLPELAALVGCPQNPDWHPEGDVWVHTGHVVQALAADPAWLAAPAPHRRRVMLAALLHDIGKPACTAQVVREGRLVWTSPGHEAAGAPLAENCLRRLGAPGDDLATIPPLVANHMIAGTAQLGDAALRRLARRLAPANIADLALLMAADTRGRPPRQSPEILARIATLAARADALAISDAAPRPLLLGRHLIARSQCPGPGFKAILDAAYEAQLDGAFSDESTALIWLNSFAPGPTEPSP
jgi:tRNA nucleotidyltransferase (CCA-adding enzyme)